MAYYCRLGSLFETNLQLYALQQAAASWNELVEDISKSEIDSVSLLKERLVFILSCLGLSLAQLLGQNWPSTSKEKIDEPGTLLGHILKNNSIERSLRKRLHTGFSEFLLDYGAVRHFGINKDDSNYRRVDSLDILKLERYKSLAIEIWDTMILIFQRDPASDIECESIADAVYFAPLPTDHSKPSARADGGLDP